MNKINKIGLILMLLCIIAVIVGVIWTASTGQSGQRVYLVSALISMCLVLFFWWVRIIHSVYYEDTHDTIFELLAKPRVYGLPIIYIVVFGIALMITGVVSASTGNTDVNPYLISAVVAAAFLIIVAPIINV